MTFLLFLFLLPLSSLLAFDLEGRVRLEGKPPAPVWLEVAADQQSSCGTKMLSPKLKVSPEGFVANAVVKLSPLTLPSSLPGEKVEGGGKNFILDQIHCEFAPHVLLVPRETAVSILNSDGFLHNVRAFDESAEMLFNDAMPKKGQVLKKRFGRPGRILLRCGVHHWMHAIVFVQEHPFYAVTDEEGHFKIEGIPEGTYKLSVWHESLGEIREEIGTGTPSLTLTYPAKTEA